MNHEAVLYYVHDPMCSWCWGHRAVWQQLSTALADRLPVQYLTGGLAPDSDDPIPDQIRQYVIDNWRQVTLHTGAAFNYDFWHSNTPRRSTYPACRASIAARWQQAERAMIDALQQAYYQRALNPSDTEVHVQLAGEIGLDIDRFQADLSGPELDLAFRAEMAFARSLPIEGFPSMVLRRGLEDYPIVLDYRDHRPSLRQIEQLLAP